MARQSNAQELHNARLLAAGLDQNGERLAKRGITKEFIKEMHANLVAVQKAESEQETLKARLKEKNAAQSSETRKLVKLELPQEYWKEFGIKDQR